MILFQPSSMRFVILSAILSISFTSGCLTTPTNKESATQSVELSSAASPERQQEGLAIVANFEDWMSKQRVRSGSIAVSYQGSPVINKGIGRDANQPYPVASLSKSITAVCTQTLLDQQGKKVSQTLAETIPELLQKYPLVDTRLGSVTLAQLISHNSGIHARYHRDFLANRGVFNKPQMQEQLQSLVKQKPSAAPGSGYNYNNANYLLLGVAIEALSGGNHEDVCSELILKSIGIEARLHPRWRAMSSWGGWEISSLDYLKFLNAYFTNNQILGKAPAATGVSTAIKGGAIYNLGVVTRSARGGHRFWHSGSWRWRGNGRNDQFGAYFVTLENGLMVSINYSSHVQNEKLRDLETRLFEAFRL